MTPKPLHVALMIQSLGVGGAELSLVNLINESDPALVRWSLIVFSNHIPLAKKITRSDVTICTVPKHGKISRHLIGDLVAVLQDLQPDIVHTHLFTADVWGTLAARRLKIPTVSTEHNINHEYGMVRTLVKRWVRNKSDRYVACSDAVRVYMQQKYGITKSIEVIPNGVDVAKFAVLMEPSFQKSLRLLVLGRLVPQKGHQILLHALAKLTQYDWHLDIVGEGPLLYSLEQLCGHLGLVDRVRFYGVTDAVPEVMSAHDIVVVPSLWEGLGVSAREGMAAGRLVVASKTGGLSEFIEPGKTGVLVAPHAVDALARALRDIFEHPADFGKVARQAREYARHHFGLSVMVDRYMQLYQRLVS